MCFNHIRPIIFISLPLHPLFLITSPSTLYEYTPLSLTKVACMSMGGEVYCSMGNLPVAIHTTEENDSPFLSNCFDYCHS